MSDIRLVDRRFDSPDLRRAERHLSTPKGEAARPFTGMPVESCKTFIGEAPSRFCNEPAGVAPSFGR